MDLFEKFSAVEVQTANRLTDADRQFCEQQQKLYQDAVSGFYQIAALWTDMCSQQKDALNCSISICQLEQQSSTDDPP